LNQDIKRIRQHPVQGVYLLLAIAGLACVYIFQRKEVLGALCQCQINSESSFILMKTLRVVLNDLFMLLIIHFWFNNSSITRLAFWIQLIDMFVLLPLYLLLKLQLEGDSEISSPLLSQFHRLIVNPTLMILIFPAVYFQRLKKSS